MPNLPRYFRIGLLVSGAFLLLVGTLFYLGLAERFAERIHFVTTFSESVQGLTKGSEVKYKGVPIGNVEHISIMPNAKTIRVDMSIDPKVFLGFQEDDVSDLQMEEIRQFWIKERNAGLCCYLELAGITGMRYIEMNYPAEEKRRKTALPVIDEPDTVYIPSAPSTFNNIIDSVALSLDKIASVDIQSIARNLDSNLESLSTILGNPAIRQTIDQVERASANIEKVSRDISQNLTGEELRSLINSVSHNLDSLNLLTREVQEKLDVIDTAKLNNQLVSSLQESRKLLEDLRNSNHDALRTMQQISGFLDNLSELIDSLKQDPSSLIRGKNAPEIRFDAQ
ncbi:MAG: MCE family protein [Lentisphaerae bacterium]|nr:MCE family protein [Lentisphaerota bacterium]